MRDAVRLLVDIPNKVRDLLGIMVDVNLEREGGVDLLEISVDPYPYPVSCKGEYHYRSGSTKQELKGAALDRFLLRKLGRTWDAVPVPQVAVADLSSQALNRFRQLAAQSRRLDEATLHEPDDALVEKLNLREGEYLKRAAVLLFHATPERWFIGASVKIGFFRSDSDLVYHDEVHGDLFMQVQKTIELLTSKYLKAVISYRGIDRIETLPVPEAALREAVLNALIHRDYAVGAPIQIRVYDDRLRIWNPGELPERWSLQTLLQVHASRPFNPHIANTFFRAGEIEAWGRGIQKIVEACRKAAVPEPRIEQAGSDWAVEFAFSDEYLARLHGQLPGLRPEVTLEVTPEVTPEVRVVLALQGEMKRQALQLALGLKDAEHFRLVYLLPAIAAGWVAMTLPDKPQSSRQRYRLTPEGEALRQRVRKERAS